MATLRFMSNNQWKCDDNKPAWEEKGMDCSSQVRMRGFARMLQETQPDIVGLQEVSFKMGDRLIRYSQDLGMEYTMLWGRDTPIIYRADKFELVDAAFHLYSTEVPGLEGSFNNGQTKSYCIGVFRVKESGKLIVFGTTHLWWKNEHPNNVGKHHYQLGSNAARVHQIGLFMDRVEAMQAKYGCPAIIMGDMNCNYRSDPIQAALARGFVHAHEIATEYADAGNGHHHCGNDGFSPYEPRAWDLAIDHILLKNAPEGCVKRYDRFAEEYYMSLSDHLPVWVDMEL